MEVDPGLIPADQSVHGEAVTEIVGAGTALAGTVQADLSDQVPKDVVEGVVIEAGSGGGQEEGGRFGVGAEPVSDPGVSLEGSHACGMDGYGPALLELGGPDRDHPLLPVDVVPVKTDRLPAAHPGHGQKP